MKKIAIVSSGRSHLLNLAIYLLNEGYDVKFYCLTPYRIITKYGFPKKYTKSFCFYLAPIVFLLFKCKLPLRIKKILFYISDLLIDNLSAIYLEKCDIFIGAASVANYSAKIARRKYGAKVICDSGTLHLKEQQILNNGNMALKYSVKRAINFYDHSDKIVVAGEHVKRSFLKHGVLSEKIFVNPYGVDISQFKPTKLKEIYYDVIFVGTWSYIKGCDILAESCLRDLKLKLLHVGGIGDLPLPKSELFTHVDYVPQSQLIEYYSMSKIFILPSRSDGFGLVIAQAMASGLPIVFSLMTGGSDLVKISKCDPKYTFLISDLNVSTVSSSIKKALDIANEQNKNEYRDYILDNRINLEWNNYGIRYINFMNAII